MNVIAEVNADVQESLNAVYDLEPQCMSRMG
jgi:hypothetical protein